MNQNLIHFNIYLDTDLNLIDTVLIFYTSQCLSKSQLRVKFTLNITKIRNKTNSNLIKMQFVHSNAQAVKKIKITSLLFFQGYIVLLGSTLFLNWFNLNRESYTLFAINSNSPTDLLEKTCATAYNSAQGFICLCDHCDKLIPLHKAGYWVLLSSMLGFICMIWQLYNL